MFILSKTFSQRGRCHDTCNHEKLIFSLILFTLHFFAFVVVAEAQDKDKVLPEGGLQVELEKSNYLLLEPIFIKLKYKPVSNVNKSTLLEITSVRITSNSETREFRGLTQIVTQGEPQSLPGNNRVPGLLIPEPQLSYCEKYGVIDRVSEFFPQPGNYRLQFFLNGLTSSPIDIKVEHPIGAEKKAFEFLKKREGNVSFYWVWNEKNGVSLLEEFVDRYGRSAYGDMAIHFLGNIYFAKGQFDKARIEFEKLINSRHLQLVEDARRLLVDIEKRKAEIE